VCALWFNRGRFRVRRRHSIQLRSRKDGVPNYSGEEFDFSWRSGQLFLMKRSPTTLSARSWRSSCTGRGWPNYPSKSASDYIVYAFMALILLWAWLALYSLLIMRVIWCSSCSGRLGLVDEVSMRGRGFEEHVGTPFSLALCGRRDGVPNGSWGA
jgi:hypothetical protein